MKYLRGLILVLGVALALGVGYSTVYRSGPHSFGKLTWGSKEHRTDFTVYHHAGQAVLKGANIYEVSNPRGWVYQYLPVFAVAMVPLALLNVFWASLVWYLLSVGMFMHTLWMSVQLVRRFFPKHQMEDFWVGALAALLVVWPVISGLERGQASLLVMWLVTLSVSCQLERHTWSAGLALAGAIVTKIFPGLLLLYWLVKRQWVEAMATMIWLAVLVLLVPSLVFGADRNMDLLRQWVTTVAVPTNQPGVSDADVRYKQMISPYIERNQSVQAVVIRWMTDPQEAKVDRSLELTARHVAMVANMTLLLVSGWACRRSGQRQVLLEMCVAMLLMLFLSPVSWVHNYTLLVLPVAAALAVGVGENCRPMRLALLVFAVATMLALTVSFCRAYGVFLGGTLALWICFVRELARRRYLAGPAAAVSATPMVKD